MPPRLHALPLRPLKAVSHRAAAWRPFWSSAPRAADDPVSDLQDTMSPARTRRPDAGPTPSRPPTVPSDASNPALHGYPSASGKMTTSTASPDLMTPEAARSQQPSNPHASLLGLRNNDKPSRPGQVLNQSLFNTSPRRRDRPRASAASRVAENRARQAAEQAAEQQLRATEGHVFRAWRAGDVYAPHDLSPAEQQKARWARTGGRRSLLSVNTRGKRQPDVLDQLNLDPRREYKNFALLGEFTSDMGRIKHAMQTGLRPVNQRRMAKAIRRAIGLGIMPSVHRHPELLPQRIRQRAYIRENIKNEDLYSYRSDM